MPKTTISDLLKMVESLQQEIESLKEQLNYNVIQYVAEVRPPSPISKPINFSAIANNLSGDYASYVEDDYWGFNTYL